MSRLCSSGRGSEVEAMVRLFQTEPAPVAARPIGGVRRSGRLSISKDRIMPPGRTVARSLVTLGVLAGLGAAFVAGTSYGGPGRAGADPWRDGSRGHPAASPAAYTGSDLSPAGACEDLLAWYVERGVDPGGAYGWDSGYAYGGIVEDATPLSAAGSAAEGSVRGPVAGAPLPATVRSTSGETGTNVQEAGVDEPDVVKTDGRTLFRVEGSNLVTYDVTGDEVHRLGSADLPGLVDAEILLFRDTVVAIAQQGGDVSADSARTELVTLDVSEPASPTVTHTVEYDSALVTARL